MKTYILKAGHSLPWASEGIIMTDVQAEMNWEWIKAMRPWAKFDEWFESRDVDASMGAPGSGDTFNRT